MKEPWPQGHGDWSTNGKHASLLPEDLDLFGYEYVTLGTYMCMIYCVAENHLIIAIVDVVATRMFSFSKISHNAFDHPQIEKCLAFPGRRPFPQKLSLFK